VCGSLGGQLSTAAEQCRKIASSCETLAGYIDDAHNELINELIQFLAITAIIEAAGALIAVPTVGIGEGVAQGVEAAEVASVLDRITTIITELFVQAKAAATGMTVATLDVTSDGIKAILKLSPKLSDAAAVNDLAKTLSGIADRLAKSPWLLGPSPRGFTIEARLGGNLPDSFPTIDKWDPVTGTVTSIKSIDLASPSYQSENRLRSLLRGYVDKVSNFSYKTWGGVKIEAGDVSARVLEVAIPRTATGAQQAVLDEMRNYAEENGVQLIVVNVR
jgi:hypothetical protein